MTPRKASAALPRITQAQMDALKQSGHVVHLYPRKQLVCVDGSKYYHYITK